MGWKDLDWKLKFIIKFIIMLVICSIIGVIMGFTAVATLGQGFGELTLQDIFWIGFGIGFIIPIGVYLCDILGLGGVSERSKRWFSLKEGNVYEKVEKVEEKDKFKNLDWLKHQYYDLGKSIQNIADDQGVSMITIRKWIDKIEKG